MEREAVLPLEELHMVNIRQHELRLLDFSSGLKHQLVISCIRHFMVIISATMPPVIILDFETYLLPTGQALDDLERIRAFSSSTLTTEGALSTYLQDRGICIKSVGQQRLEKQQQAFQAATGQLLYSSI